MKTALTFLVRLSIILASVFPTLVLAQDKSSSLPPVQTQGQTEFLTGGIGQDEAEAISRAASSWPLTIELSQAAAPRAEYISDVQITIKDKSGNIVLDTNAEGPYVLVKLPPAKYSLDAVYGSKTLHRDITLQKGRSKRISLMWPAAPQ
ncbi:carboxypeptidase-like regulatory domain-containing protein [Nitrosovibrio tenuis]|uniref:Carboxypeptidase regulatory-like domain-containing protein n=1 Tax=Nitrosovibrio tenuis TaxID=1233 RepID=A0A1H7IJG8_9PROT|nr:carboxypeptidase-like regulatory domain-containing protein [Nitrosovibrio tenuis]SEK62484.1 hypothetical protein SAMN05216387_102192 [Nitrosovibrio tenuis]